MCDTPLVEYAAPTAPAATPEPRTHAMHASVTDTAQTCLDGAYAGTMDFPSIVRTLIEQGFEGYDVDYRRGTATYFLANGETLQLSLPHADTTIAPEFRASDVERAVREAQNHTPGYTYAGFCEKVMTAGCAGYMVSFLGKRVVYFGRTAETHVEHFPQ
jgi:uncharacterized protein YbcV (DUF1398 family)